MDAVRHGIGSMAAIHILAELQVSPFQYAELEVLPVLHSWACVWPCGVHDSFVLGHVEIAS
jgi:hypothetical protein